MRDPNKLTATNWKVLREFEHRVSNVYTHETGRSFSPLTVAETMRLLHDVRAYKTLLMELKRSKGSVGS